MFSSAALLIAASAFASWDTIYSDTFDLTADGCPNTSLRLTTSRIRYPNTNNTVRLFGDLTRFEGIWGHATSNDAELAWPGGNQYTSAMLDFDKDKFVAARFHVPADFPTTDYGFFVYASYYSGPLLTLSLSERCNDFAPADERCVATRGTGEIFQKWRIVPSAVNCPLTPGVDYFVNIRLADPQAAACGGNPSCQLAVGNVLGQ
jgi:hypothetical protein